MELTGKDLGVLKTRIQGKKDKDGKKGKGKVVAAQSGTADTPATGEGGESSDERDPKEEQKALDLFWKEIEAMDPVSLISDDVVDAFKYVGFDPDVVLKEFLFRGSKAVEYSVVKKDMIDVVTLAIIKGSVTELNLKKTSDAGKVLYKNIATRYGLSIGSTKGKDSTFLTAARVAAAVPGLVAQILIKKPDFAKTFNGPFGSKILPSYLRHQSAAACLPDTLPERLKEFVLGLIIAFTSDQTKTLSKVKTDSAEEIYDRQSDFVLTTYNSKHPTEESRAKIFKNFSLSNDYEKLHPVALKIKKVKSDFVVLTQVELDELLSKV
jgi:hypothetical protein